MASLFSGEWAIFALYGAIAMAALLCGLLWFLFTSVLYSLLLKLFWSKPPVWSRITFNKQDWLMSYLFGVIASLPGSLLIATAGSDRLVADLSYLERETPIAT